MKRFQLTISLLLIACMGVYDHPAVAQQAMTPLEYRLVGPSRGGRVTAVAGVNSQPNTYYMGATGGGL